jgi:ribosomal protein L11 methyltransferase
MPWLAVTLEVNAAAAEALSEALLEAGAQSVGIEHPDQARVGVHALLRSDADARAVVDSAAAAAKLPGRPAYAVTRVEDADWVRTSQSQFAPFELAERLWIGPSWHEPPASARAVVRLDPGLAFGTGSHPSTRLVLRFLAEHIHGGERVLDYGCGSGILALAAAKLGAARVDATDIDAEALETAAANARANRVALRLGAPEALSPEAYDIVVANILAQPLVVLAPLLAARSACGGRIALSGILVGQAGEVSDAYRPWYDIGVAATEDDWALVTGIRT